MEELLLQINRKGNLINAFIFKVTHIIFIILNRNELTGWPPVTHSYKIKFVCNVLSGIRFL